ncbi:WD domain G-beta repeat protein [Paragonimus heterotremus]|uniref:tRNA (34-2'-O)-methyltransferase regulator WDR6 n=1 Tax=Paragonimus heterotremus TaxID=100268 RepID=A0A8J4SXN6_9TREM|nr:WD domain G-beta repeat protein [Paragonimus heterotremus]
MVVAVGGSRFYAGLLMGSSFYDISELFVQYRSDNIVYCSAKPWENSALFCFLSAHYETILVRVILNEGRLVTFTEARTPSKSSLCYSGFVECHWKTTFLDSVKFVGSTFGRIDIFRSKLDFLNEEPCLHNEVHVGVLTSQKGAIFSVDFLRVPPLKCLRLCSAAEDRSIAVWSLPLKEQDTDLESEFFGSWCLLYLLKGGGVSDEIIFEARIWKVGLSEHGLLAVGEDCRIVWYPWSAMHKRIVMSDLHRGHSVWSADAYYPEDDSGSVILATGGNDGAVYVQSCKMNGFDSLAVSFELNMNKDTARSMVKPDCSSCVLANDCLSAECSTRIPLKSDFPRCLFFGPDGRIFCLSDMGFILTPSITFDSFTDVRPFFRYTVSELLLRDRCESSVTVNQSITPNSFVPSDVRPWCQNVFRGYTVSGTNRSHSLAVIGDKQGQLGLFQFLRGAPYLVCTDLMQLGKKIMKIVWTSDTSFLVGLQNGPAVFLTTNVLTDHLCLFGERSIRFTLPPGCTMRWANAACCPQVTDTCGFKRSVMIIGTRDGGLYSYVFSSLSGPTRSQLQPSWTLETCHGRGGCTAITEVPYSDPPAIVSCGRTQGEIRQWLVHSDGSLVLTSLVPNSNSFTWIERFLITQRGHLFAFGFHSVDFKAFRLTSNNESDTSELTFSFEALNKLVRFQASCGGGNRYWDCWIPDVDEDSIGSSAQLVLVEHANIPGTFALQVVEHAVEQSCPSPTLASVNRGAVVVHTWRTATRKTCSLASDLICLRPSLHGRDVNCCLLLSTASTGRSCNYEPGDHDQTDDLLFYCFAGGEDTCLSSWTLKFDHENSSEYRLFHPPEHHRGHMSSIRCLTMPVRSSGAKYVCRFVSDYLLTGGGRGQLCLWSLSFGVSSRHSPLRPGWLGFTRLRLTAPQAGKCSTISSDVSDDTYPALLSKQNSSSDLRIMGIVCVELDSDTLADVPLLLALAACSDGSLRILIVQPPCSKHPKCPKFKELGTLEQLCHSPLQFLGSPACYLDMKLLSWTGSELCVLTTNTASLIECWSVHRSGAIGPLGITDSSWNAVRNWILISQPIAPYLIQTKPALNCIDAIHSKSPAPHVLVSVGADDGSVRVAMTSGVTKLSPKWIATAICHYAAVIRLAITSHNATSDGSLELLSLSADQRIIHWRCVLETGTRILYKLYPLCRSVLPGIGDPHALCVDIRLDKQFDVYARRSKWALVAGTGTFLFQVEPRG